MVGETIEKKQQGGVGRAGDRKSKVGWSHTAQDEWSQHSCSVSQEWRLESVSRARSHTWASCQVEISHEIPSLVLRHDADGCG